MSLLMSGSLELTDVYGLCCISFLQVALSACVPRVQLLESKTPLGTSYFYEHMVVGSVYRKLGCKI